MYVRLAVVLYHVCTMLDVVDSSFFWGSRLAERSFRCVESKCLSQGQVGRCPYVLETVARVLCVDMKPLLFFSMPPEH